MPYFENKKGAKLQSIKAPPPDLLDLPVGCPFTPRFPYVKHICHKQIPPLEDVDLGHQIASWVDIKTGELG